MSRIFLVRHGQTAMNIRHCLQGRTDTKLNETGIRQAQGTRDFLKKEHLKADVVYVSPLQRARRTAEIVTGFSPEMCCVEPRLIEMSFGDFEGTEVENMPEKARNELFRDPASFGPYGDSETVEEVIQRTNGFLAELSAGIRSGQLPDHPFCRTDEKEPGNIFLVSHGAAIHAMICGMKQMDPKDFWSFDVDNCALLEIFPEQRDCRVLFPGYHS